MAADLILKVTPAEVETKSTEIGAKHTQMEGLMTEMTGLVQQLSTAWSSTAGDAYVQQYENVKREITDSLTRLQTHVDHLKSVAQAYEQLETEQNTTVSGLDTSDIF